MALGFRLSGKSYRFSLESVDGIIVSEIQLYRCWRCEFHDSRSAMSTIIVFGDDVVNAVAIADQHFSCGKIRRDSDKP